MSTATLPTAVASGFAGRTVLVVGAGESGAAIARWVAAGGGGVRIVDTRAAPPGREALAAAVPAATWHTGGVDDGDIPGLLAGITQIAISPGLSPIRAPVAALLAAAQARGIEVVGEIELFARALAALGAAAGYAPRVVGITGTNGKTTVTRLTALLLERAGERVAVAGNISPSALASIHALLDGGTAGADSDFAGWPTVWVLELSSFQLATTSTLACAAAVVLNVTQDHLDWHGTFDAYAAAKGRLFAHCSLQIVNRDDAVAAALARRGAATVSFGADAPTQPDTYGLVHDGDLLWLAYAEDLSVGGRRRKAAADLPGIDGQIHLQRLMPAAALKIRGRHNALNALAALALARALGAPWAPLLHGLRDYAGEPHRVETVATIGGVEFIDDSKGTNVGATVAALDGLGADGRKLIVILGGDGKGQDFAPLAAAVHRHARAAVLIGRDAAVIRAALGDAAPVVTAADLTQAVADAAGHAQPGDAVLLSPACASLDMFRDYRHRAEVFAAAVRALGLEQGQPC